MVKKILTLFALLILAVMISPAAKADQIVLNLTTSNANAGNPWTTPTGNFGTVTFTLLAGGDVQVSVQLAAGYYMMNDAMGFNWGGSVAAPTIAVSGLPIGYSLAYGGVPQTGNQLHMDGFGNYNYGIIGPNVGQGGQEPEGLVNSMVFTIVGDYTTVQDFVAPNAVGRDVTLHVYNINSTAANKTGYVTTGTITTPEPGSLTLLLLGAGALLVGARRQKLI